MEVGRFDDVGVIEVKNALAYTGSEVHSQSVLSVSHVGSTGLPQSPPRDLLQDGLRRPGPQGNWRPVPIAERYPASRLEPLCQSEKEVSRVNNNALLVSRFNQAAEVLYQRVTSRYN